MYDAKESDTEGKVEGCMEKRRSIFRIVLFGAVLLASSACSVLAQSPGVELDKALARLDATAQKFKSAEAEVVWDNVQTQPIYDKDTQTGTVYFERRKGGVSMALHLKTLDGKPVPKEMVYDGGEFKLYEPMLKQETIFKTTGKQSEIESFLALGFGGSGADLKKNWNVSYSGAETINGIQTSRLVLLPLNDSTKQNVSKVILWVDMANGIAIRQQSYDPSGNYRMVNYKIVHLNGGVPGNAFEIKTASGTRVINR
uniref:MucB/RseB N-terminal domain-containing protein n=1 Tax=mine drainage metagenome TaxID=410659 RepID=E6Q0E1_9ZZZZ